MTATAKLIEEEEAYKFRNQLLAELPATAMRELQAACRASQVDQATPAALLSACKSSAAAALALEPAAGAGADPRKGALLVDVFIWACPGIGRK